MAWGILGTGAIAAHFAVAARQNGYEIAAVASRGAQRGADFAGHFGISTSVVGSEALAKLPNVTAVYIATPNAHHAIAAKAMIAAGKAVLCEKPLATSAAQAAEVVTAAKAAGVFCMEGLWSLTLPSYRAVLSAIASGQIGELREIHGSFCVPQAPETMPGLFAGPTGGALLDRGVYLIALTRALAACQNDHPLRLVHAVGDLTPNGTDLAVTLLCEAGPVRAVLNCAIDRMAGNTLTLVGSQGRIVLQEPVPNPHGYLITKADPAKPFAAPSGLPGVKEKLKTMLLGQPRVRQLANTILRGPTGRAGSLADQIGHVEQCLAQGLTESPLVPLEGSVAVLEIIDTARKTIYSNTA